MTYESDEKSRATAWKRSIEVLPEAAKIPAPYVGKDGQVGPRPYPFCLPPAYSPLSLLPEVRDDAIALFAELQIPWHAGVDGGPSNHLLSSQVQCVNALGQMVADPTRIKRAFGDLLGVDEVLEIEPGRYLTFEYIGPTDFFGEARGGSRIRGAHCTSVDAAFLHRAIDGVIELVLVEWKYTEKYGKRPVQLEKDKTRLYRYGAALADPNGPVRDDLLSFEHLVDEPFYQLMRQQLLAHELEKAGAEGAGRVRLVHVSPPANLAYQESICRPEQRALGDSVSEIWKRLLRHPDRFLSVDSAVFLNPEITSKEYAFRYGEPVIADLEQLLAHFGIDDVRALEDTLDYDGDITADDEGLEFYLDRIGTGLPFPFFAYEVVVAARSSEAEAELDD